MPVILKNNASSTLTTGITASDTGIVVASGSQFPAIAAGEYFYVTLVSQAGTTEIVKVTARVGNSMTVVRAQEGSTAASFQVGTLVDMRVTAASVTELRDEASEITIADAGGYYAATTVEGALQEAATGLYYRHGATGTVARTVQNHLRDIVSVKDFGAVGDGVTDDTAEIQAALNYGIANGKAVYIPSGVYMFGGPPINPTFINGKSLSIFGDGPGLTVIKEIPGTTQARGTSFNATFYFAVTNVTVPQISVRNLTCDKSGSGTTPSTPGSFQYQQSHCFSVFSSGTGVIENVTFENVITKDKIGGGIVLAAGLIEQASIQNCHGTDFLYTGGERGDVEFQASVGQLNMVGCGGRYVQSEPNATSPIGGIKPNSYFINCEYDVFDMAGYSAAKDAQTYFLTGCNNTKTATGETYMLDGVYYINDCVLRVTSRYDWRNATSKISNSTIVIGHDTTTNAFSSLYISTISIVKQDHIFSNCKFIADSTASGTTTGYAFIGSVAAPGANYKVVFRDCTFDPVFQYTADCYANGTVTFERCKLASRLGGWAIQAGAYSTFVCDVTIDSCDLSQVAGSFIRIAAAGASAWRLTFVGAMDYAKFSILNRPATEYQDTKVTHNGYWLADARPAAGGLNGQIVKLRKPTVGSASEFVVSVGNITTATFRSTAQAGINRGVTGSRPAPNANDIGLQYLDTTLDADGKPIWWTGTAWVHATGLVV